MVAENSRVAELIKEIVYRVYRFTAVIDGQNIVEPWFPVNLPGIQSIEQVILSCWLLIRAQVDLPLVLYWLLITAARLGLCLKWSTPRPKTPDL